MWLFRASVACALAAARLFGLVLVVFAAAACSDTLPDIRITRLGAPSLASGFRGVIVAGEPNAVQAGEKILQAHGNAADAAVALAFALAVTLPSRAGLAGNGICAVHDTDTGITEAITFAQSGEGAMPLARGMAALHGRYGRLPWSAVVAPAESMARFGFTVSHALAQDIVAASDRLAEDGAALGVFLTARRRLVSVGDQWREVALAEILAAIQAQRFYAGPAGNGPVHRTGDIPAWTPIQPWSTAAGKMFVAAPGVRADTATNDLAGTGFTVADADGNAVACALTIGRLFGAGHMVDGMFAPARESAPLAVVIGTTDANQPQFAAAVAGRDAVLLMRRVQESGPSALSTRLPEAISAWSCPNALVNDGMACHVSIPPLGYGLIVPAEHTL